MKKLFIHIGLPKTGSSAIQSWLSLNAEKLIGQDGIYYADLNPAAKDGRITSGNAKWLNEVLHLADQGTAMPDDFAERFMATYFNGHQVALVSGESLSNISRESLQALRAKLEVQQVQIKIIAYIRNVYDHAWSAFQQHVKRSGYHHSFEKFSKDYSNPQVRFIKVWSDVFPDLFLSHYDSVKSRLIASFCDALGVSEQAYEASSATGNVNRSLTEYELQLLLHLNGQAKVRGLTFKGVLSDALIYEEPGAKAFFYYNETIINSFKRRFDKDLQWVHERFPSCASLCVTAAAPPIETLEALPAMPTEVKLLFNALCGRIAFYQRRAKAG